MSAKRKRHSPEFKFRVALEAAKEQQTISQLTSEFSPHPNQIRDWKKQLLEKGKTVFQPNGKHKIQTIQESELYKQIGRLKMELEWIQKKICPLQLTIDLVLLSQIYPVLSIRRQCELIGLNRSTYYYKPAKETPLNLTLMRLI